MSRIIGIWAEAHGRVIGANGRIPWHIQGEQEWFRDATWGHVVVMGRKTWESLPVTKRPLPGRTNIVVSERGDFTNDDPQPDYHETSWEDARKVAVFLANLADCDVFVLGGEQLLRSALDDLDEAFITKVDLRVFEGDTFAPLLPSSLEYRERLQPLPVRFGDPDWHVGHYVHRFLPLRSEL